MSKRRVKVESKVDGLRPAQFILEHVSNIEAIYEIEPDPLGSGAFGTVRRATHRVTNVVRAVKTIPKAKVMNIPIFKHEVAIMKMLDHPSIIKLFETFEDSKQFHLAMQLCSGGELFHRINAVGRFTETQAAIVMRQVISAVYYMHERQIVHRDLKPENYMFMCADLPLDTSLPARNPVKLIDFGFACRFAPGMFFSSEVGTPGYMAPEVYQKKYNHMCDLWSCGVIMYVILFGRMPFTATKEDALRKQQRLGQWSFGTDDHLSESAKALISSLLQRDPLKRCTPVRAINDKWQTQVYAAVTHGTCSSQLQAQLIAAQGSFVEHLKGFKTENKLKKATLEIIAGQLPPKDLRALRVIFATLDSNGDGRVSREELKASLKRAGLQYSDSDVDAIMDSIDTDSSGMIDWTEFLAVALDHPKYLTRDACWTAFNVFDLDGDGKISQDELERVLFDGSKHDQRRSRKKTKDLLHQLEDGCCIDAGGDGTINFEQFMDVMLTAGCNRATCTERHNLWLQAVANVEDQLPCMLAAKSSGARGGA
jgi:calcium-dependent protein kinase